MFAVTAFSVAVSAIAHGGDCGPSYPGETCDPPDECYKYYTDGTFGPANWSDGTCLSVDNTPNAQCSDASGTLLLVCPDGFRCLGPDPTNNTADPKYCTDRLDTTAAPTTDAPTSDTTAAPTSDTTAAPTTDTTAAPTDSPMANPEPESVVSSVGVVSALLLATLF